MWSAFPAYGMEPPGPLAVTTHKARFPAANFQVLTSPFKLQCPFICTGMPISTRLSEFVLFWILDTR
ncbi:hypothetical protein PAXRUDRAFT_835838 [Paxillus rubicundulus Ve08.2h10]|uniref:Uncharacterized protein n=1 Tax=Paxillus rubicundulus Ve08.2h10 TaxID=930991 RepID=A0A0D0CIJ1_9AGAM|nr:hypothetical protein PAXRUDRAFT_835838 [Paxillus rubicundulus Ve08.2h10]